MAAATILCLAPFSGRAFHVDDTLFVWCAQHIVQQPLNPYGFELTWDASPQAMSEITQNPPLASYYAALAGSVFGWSERALHLSFLLITVLLILGTYRLASKFTRFPLLAALATLLTPGVMVSASSVMCDTMMLAIWVWASIFWIEGLERNSVWFFVLASFLAGTSALTKYFGIALLPLFAVYALVRTRRAGMWMYCLLIPVAMLIAYQAWTQGLYGHGLLFGAAEYAERQRALGGASSAAMAIVGLSFAGGCALSVLAFAPMLVSPRWIVAGALASWLGALAIMLGWVNVGFHIGGVTALGLMRQDWWVGCNLGLWVMSGVVLLTVTAHDYWETRTPESLFLGLWVFGTYVFAAFVNYTANARSVLPMIPAAGILIARRVERHHGAGAAKISWKAAIALAASGTVALVVCSGDAHLANSAREAAALVVDKTRSRAGTLWFEGHWGFQYYMERNGARPMDTERPQVRPGDTIVIPFNNYQLRAIPPRLIASQEDFDLRPGGWASTIEPTLGAGFYSSYWGPLPFVLAPPPAERYTIVELTSRPAAP